MLTSNMVRINGWVKVVNGKPAPEHLIKLRIPPAWTKVTVDPDPTAPVVARGFDSAGRHQRLYSRDHIAAAKSGKFERVQALLSEWEDIRTQIESDLNDKTVTGKEREAALVAYLIYETAMRPGSNAEVALVTGIKAFGATTLQLRHVKRAAKGVRLKFVGKKGVKQNVLVTNPHLVREMVRRKKATTAWTTPLFDVSNGYLLTYFKKLGSGQYTPKDFRTARGTSLALELLGNRTRFPRSMADRKRLVNKALDKVAKMLGNTRAISRSAYVEPSILDRVLSARKFAGVDK